MEGKRKNVLAIVLGAVALVLVFVAGFIWASKRNVDVVVPNGNESNNTVVPNGGALVQEEWEPIDNGREFEFSIKMNASVNGEEVESISNIYKKGLNTAVIYAEPVKGPFPGSTISAGYQLGKQAYTCMNIDGEDVCVVAEENSQLAEIFDFDMAIQMILPDAGDSHEETINGEMLKCFDAIHEEEGFKMSEKFCINDKEQFMYGESMEALLDEEGNVINYAEVKQTVIHRADTVADESVFEINTKVQDREDFEEENEHLFAPAEGDMFELDPDMFELE